MKKDIVIGWQNKDIGSAHYGQDRSCAWVTNLDDASDEYRDALTKAQSYCYQQNLHYYPDYINYRVMELLPEEWDQRLNIYQSLLKG